MYGLFKSAVPFARASKIASDDRKSRNNVLPEIPVIVDNAWPSVMIASEVIHGAGMLKDRRAKVCSPRIVDKRSRPTQKSNAVIHSQPSIAIAVVTSPFIASCG